MSLTEFGWNKNFDAAFVTWANAGCRAGRIARESRELYELAAATGPIRATLSGRLRAQAQTPEDLPVVGDWVAFQATDHQGVIRGVLPRKSLLSRKAAGATARRQPLAANVDTVFLVMALDGDFNLRRLERYVAMIWESGALPAVLLNKTDVCAEFESRVFDAELAAPGVAVHAISCHDKRGLEHLNRYLSPGKTAVLTGSSGVGKSTLVNLLVGKEILKTREVRAHDQRGRHTTTHRELVLLPGGAMLIDGPGMRELQPWSSEESLDLSFEDIQQLAAECRFNDCSHQSEPGCAVLRAVSTGRLNPERLENYRTLQKEMRYLAIRNDERLQREEKRKIAAIHRSAKKIKFRW